MVALKYRTTAIAERSLAWTLALINVVTFAAFTDKTFITSIDVEAAKVRKTFLAPLGGGAFILPTRNLATFEASKCRGLLCLELVARNPLDERFVAMTAWYLINPKAIFERTVETIEELLHLSIRMKAILNTIGRVDTVDERRLLLSIEANGE